MEVVNIIIIQRHPCHILEGQKISARWASVT
jgi:hypothetical protein